MNGLGLWGEGGWLKIGTPGISQVLQRRLGRHARYLSGSPTHTRQARQVCARCQDREIQQHIKAHTHAGGHPWCQPMVRFKPLVWAHAEQGSHCNVLHCRNTYGFKERNSSPGFWKIFFVCIVSVNSDKNAVPIYTDQPEVKWTFFYYLRFFGIFVAALRTMFILENCFSTISLFRKLLVLWRRVEQCS